MATSSKCRLLRRPRAGGNRQLAEDGRVGGPLSGAEPRHSDLSDLPRRHGNAPTATGDAKTKRIAGGRVEVSLLKNNLEQLASTTTTSTADQPQQK